MKQFAYYEPTLLAELLDLLVAQEEYQLLAGGTDLLVKWKRGAQSPRKVINLKQIQELNFLHSTEQGLEMGALMKVNELLHHDIVCKQYPALAEAAHQHSSPLIRNLATVAGNICNASPAADLVPALLIYGGRVRVRSQVEEWLIALKDFFVGPGKTVLQKGEVVTSILLPRPSAGMKSVFAKEGKRKAHEIAIVNCALSYTEWEGQMKHLQIALGAVGPKPLLLTNLDWFTAVTEANLNQLASEIEQKIAPITDQRSTDWYRREVVQVVVRRALQRAQIRLEG